MLGAHTLVYKMVKNNYTGKSQNSKLEVIRDVQAYYIDGSKMKGLTL